MGYEHGLFMEDEWDLNISIKASWTFLLAEFDLKFDHDISHPDVTGMIIRVFYCFDTTWIQLNTDIY